MLSSKQKSTKQIDFDKKSFGKNLLNKSSLTELWCLKPKFEGTKPTQLLWAKRQLVINHSRPFLIMSCPCLPTSFLLTTYLSCGQKKLKMVWTQLAILNSKGFSHSICVHFKNPKLWNKTFPKFLFRKPLATYLTCRPNSTSKWRYV